MNEQLIKPQVWPETMGQLSLGQLRAFAKDLPDDAIIILRYVQAPPSETLEVSLECLGQVGQWDPAGSTPVLALGIAMRDNDVFYYCDNCGMAWDLCQLKPSNDLAERMDDNGPLPAGDCPECGAFCYRN